MNQAFPKLLRCSNGGRGSNFGWRRLEWERRARMGRILVYIPSLSGPIRWWHLSGSKIKFTWIPTSIPYVHAWPGRRVKDAGVQKHYLQTLRLSLREQSNIAAGSKTQAHLTTLSTATCLRLAFLIHAGLYTQGYRNICLQTLRLENLRLRPIKTWTKTQSGTRF